MNLPIPARRFIRNLGIDIHRRQPNLIDLMQKHGVSFVLDVGANVGQFGRTLRSWGYGGRIVSFEPVAASYARLAVEMEGDALWTGMQIGLGDTSGPVSINVSHSSDFSSILKPKDILIDYDALSAVEYKEEIDVRTLDSVMPSLGIPANAVTLLKIDTQGYEKNVLQGGAESVAKCRFLLLELSMRALYDGEEDIFGIFSIMNNLGFSPVWFQTVSNNNDSLFLQQSDCLFVNNRYASTL